MSRKYSSDSKISYGKSDNDESQETLPWKSLKGNTFHSPKRTNSKNPEEEAFTRPKEKAKKSFYEYKTAHLFLVAAVLTLLYFWFEIQLRLGPDESCW
jgi:hypothetical protein